MIYLDLFIGFLQVGFFSFGGAYSAIPLIRDVVRAHGWLSDEMITYMIAISESTPGSIMVNMATYVGSAKAGVPGAIIATTAVVIPAFTIILLLMVILKNFLGNKYVEAAFSGLKPGIIGIILATGVVMMLSNCGIEIKGDFDIMTVVLTIGIAAIYFGSRRVMKKGITPISLICISAVVGAIAYGIF
ncbi:MAG: chromate transporter [Lachnospiraceae bacterium]|nr:chromate transporter [Lachnospiraceae bacterium]